MTRRLAWLAVAAFAYLVAAWAVRPGFYDGFQPPSPYCFVSPPPQVQNCQGRATGGKQSVSVTNGVVDPGSVFTQDGQAELSFRPGAFAPPQGASQVTISIQPVATYPDTTGIKLLTNVYRITADAALNSQGALVTLQYSADQPAPSFVYMSSGSGAWTNLGTTNTAPPFRISAYTHALGYFAAGYASNAKPPRGSAQVGGGQTVPLLIALGVALVIIASLPLAFLRRRGQEEEEPEE